MLSPVYSRIAPLGLVFVLLLLLSCAPVQAQSNGDGSIYSRFGLGTLADFSSSQSEALGGGAYALRSLNYNPSANPALWSDQVFTRLSAGGEYQRIVSTQEDPETSYLTSGAIEAFQFSFPLYERTLGVGLTFQPYTRHNYRLRSQQTLSVDDTLSVPYEKNFRGKGGLHTFRGGLGYRINEMLSVGASVDVVFGILERERSTEFERSSFRNLTVSDQTRLAGISGTIGAHLAFADVLREDDALSLGASVSLPTTLTGTRVLTRGEGRNLRPDTVQAPDGKESFDGEVSLPWRSRLGVVYQPSERWAFTVDGLFEPWSTFSSDFGGSAPFQDSFPVGGEQTLTDRWRLSLGTEVIPAGEDALSGYFANIAYRLGVYTERLYVRPPNANADVQTYAVTGGFSLPTSLSGTRIDINFRAGRRGTTDNNLVRDDFYGVALHINFGERWFRKRKLR